MAQCPNTLSGYTYLGEYNSSKYFISTFISDWTSAEIEARTAGGYIVSINDADENEYIRSQLGNNMVFIGINDAQSEDTFQWANGDAVNYTNFNETNSQNGDYAVMNFWDGSWELDNYQVRRPYVVEVPCNDNMGGNGENFTYNCEFGLDTDNLPTNTEGLTLTWNAPTGSSDCAGGVTITQVAGPAPGSFFNSWIPYEVVYLIEDQCGNSQTCYLPITVPGTYGSITCPNDITVTASSDEGAVVFYDPPSVTQGTCTIGTPEQINANLVPSSGEMFPIGTTEIEYVAFANGSNTYCQTSRYCSFNIVVESSDNNGGNSGNGTELCSFTQTYDNFILDEVEETQIFY